MTKAGQFRDFFPDLEAFEKRDDSIVTYYDEVQESFYRDLLCKYIYGIPEGQADHFVATVAQDIAHGLTLPDGENTKSSALADMKEYLLLSLRNLFLMKTFVAAPNIETFVRYFPEHRAHFSHFREGNKYLCGQILTLTPNLVSECELSEDDQMDLGKVIGAVVDSFKQKECESSDAAKENYVICLMIKHWKGTSKQSLGLILRSIIDFQETFDPDHTQFLPGRKLPDLYRRFPDAGTDIIEGWYARLPEDPPLSAMKLGSLFLDQILPVLIKYSHGRQKVDSLVSKTIYDSFMSKVRDAQCEDDFWEIRMNPRLDNQEKATARSEKPLVPTLRVDSKQSKSSESVPTASVRDVKKNFKGRALIPTLRLKNRAILDKRALIPTLKSDTIENSQDRHLLIPSIRVKKEEISSGEEDTCDSSREDEVFIGSRRTVSPAKGETSEEPEYASENSSSRYSSKNVVRKSRSWLPSAEEQFAAKISGLLLKHPELCPNCLCGHELSQCPSIEADSRENVAAYFVPDYEQQVNQERLPFLERCAERLSRRQKLAEDNQEKRLANTKEDFEKEEFPVNQSFQKEVKEREPSIKEKLKTQMNHIRKISKEFKLGRNCDTTVTNNKDLLINVAPCPNILFESADGKKHHVDMRGELVYWKYAVPCYFVPTFSGSVLSMKDFKSLNKLEKIIFVDKKDRLSLNNKISLTLVEDPVKICPSDAEISHGTVIAYEMNTKARVNSADTNCITGDSVPEAPSSSHNSPVPDSDTSGLSVDLNPTVSELAEDVLEKTTRNDALRGLLRELAKDHSTYVLETSMSHRSQTTAVSRSELASFATDVQVYMPHDKSVRNLEVNERYVSGIFVGYHKVDRRVKLVWMNYSHPGEKMMVVLADKVKYTNQSLYVRIAEERMVDAEQKLSLTSMQHVPIHRSLRNLSIERVTHNVDVQTSASVVKISPITTTPVFTEAVLSDEIRETFLQSVQITKRRMRPDTFLSVASAKDFLLEVEDQKAYEIANRKFQDITSDIYDSRRGGTSLSDLRDLEKSIKLSPFANSRTNALKKRIREIIESVESVADSYGSV